MAGVTKVHPYPAADNWDVITRKVIHLELSVLAGLVPFVPGVPPAEAARDQIGFEADGGLNALYAAVQQYGTIVIAGPAGTGVISVAIEMGLDEIGTTVDQLTQMQADIRALGTVIGTKDDGTANASGIDFSGAVVTKKDYVL